MKPNCRDDCTNFSASRGSMVISKSFLNTGVTVIYIQLSSITGSMAFLNTDVRMSVLNNCGTFFSVTIMLKISLIS